MEVFKKELSASETKKSGAVKCYIIETIDKEKGGTQASYNIPNNFFEELIKKGVLVEVRNKDKTRNGGKNKIFSLISNYSVNLDKSLTKYLSYEVLNPRFLVTYGNGNKPQIRPSDYKQFKNENDGYDYNWFIELYSNNIEKNIMIYTFSELDRKLTISVSEENWINNTDYITNISSPIPYPHQRIFFGAPGTGKSFKLNKEAMEYFGTNYERVTFHPNYMYGNFVGAFKPFPKNVSGDQESISYEYVPGVLIRQLVKAICNPSTNYLLIIEEINRANVAAVFGDIFQLLDRNSEGESEYFIATSKELQLFLKKEFENFKLDDETISKLGKDFNRLFLPKNLYIWATMNSADQGVMPMDTAFRRRWEFNYIGIDDSVTEEFDLYKFKINNTEIVKWNDFRNAINKRLSNLNIPEDKLIGPYFISKTILESKDIENITKVIKNKVLMYLYEDVAKPFRNLLFAEDKYGTYSELCKYFSENALSIFKDKLEIETEAYVEYTYNEFKVAEESEEYIVEE